MSFMDAMVLRDRYAGRLKQIEKDHPSARQQEKTECCNSGVCCWRRPGALDKDDVSNIAAHFGLTEQEFFDQYLIVDGVDGDLFLLPRRKHQTGGEMIGFRETYSLESPCVFLDVENGNKCSIHEVKPISCRSFKCWEEISYGQSVGIKMSKKYLKLLGWDGVNPDY